MALDSTYHKLASALETRVALIADREWFARDAAGHLAALQAISERLDQLVVALPGPIPGELAHYLEKRSFEKALAWIREK